MNEHINIKLNGSEFRMTPRNSQLYTFLGHVALSTGDRIDLSTRNHVFLVTGKNSEGQPTGQYVFGPIVSRLASRMLELGFPADLNHGCVSERDEQAYAKYLAEEGNVVVPDALPEDLK